MERDDIDERLERLVSATKDVAPSAGFASRVMTAIESERASFGVWTFVPRAAKRVVPFAAVAACAAIVWAVAAARDADDATVSAFDTVEAEW